MAATKKIVTPVTVKTTAASAKVEAPKAEVKAVQTTTVKTDEVKKEEPAKKAEAVKKAEPAKKAATAKKAEPAAKKTAAKKATAKKAEVTGTVHIQFDGKSYSQEELLKIAKDVWKYDLKQKAADLTSIELYVKPEESQAYYVMNKEFTGSFYI